MIGEPEGRVHLEPEQFDELVSDVMDELPREWAPLLDNIVVVVEAEPVAEDIPDDAPSGTTLYGLYRGVAVPAQFLGGGLAGPARSAPLERASASLDDLRARVRETLTHEVGHHFGYSEGRLREGSGEEAENDDG